MASARVTQEEREIASLDKKVENLNANETRLRYKLERPKTLIPKIENKAGNDAAQQSLKPVTRKDIHDAELKEFEELTEKINIQIQTTTELKNKVTEANERFTKTETMCNSLSEALRALTNEGNETLIAETKKTIAGRLSGYDSVRK